MVMAVVSPRFRHPPRAMNRRNMLGGCVSISIGLAARSDAEEMGGGGGGRDGGEELGRRREDIFTRLPDGVIYEDTSLPTPTSSSGLAGKQQKQADIGDMVTFDYVLRRSNGYLVYSSVEGVSFQPRDIPTEPVTARLGAGTLLPGLEEVLLGMVERGKRKALIPARVGYGGLEEGVDINDKKKGDTPAALLLLPQPPGFSAQRQLKVHRSEPFIFEVEVTKIRKGGGV